MGTTLIVPTRSELYGVIEQAPPPQLYEAGTADSGAPSAHALYCHVTRLVIHVISGPEAGALGKMAAYLQWRRFVFFEKELVKEPLGNDGAAPGAAPVSGSTVSKFFCLPPGITVCDSGRGSLVFGDILLLELSFSSADARQVPTAGMESVNVALRTPQLDASPDVFCGLMGERRKFIF